jgi:hypothetical protein
VTLSRGIDYFVAWITIKIMLEIASFLIIGVAFILFLFVGFSFVFVNILKLIDSLRAKVYSARKASSEELTLTDKVLLFLAR